MKREALKITPTFPFVDFERSVALSCFDFQNDKQRQFGGKSS